MAQPYDYTIASPMDAFQKSYAFGTALAEREAQANRAKQVNDALVSIANDRSPENLARNLLMFPELK